MYHKFIRTRCPTLLADYKKNRNKLGSLIKIDKLQYYVKQFFDIRDDPRRIWETVNDITDRKRRPDVIE